MPEKKQPIKPLETDALTTNSERDGNKRTGISEDTVRKHGKDNYDNGKGTLKHTNRSIRARNLCK